MIESLDIPRPNFLGSGQWKVSGLKVCNILLGKNGVGKSQLMRSIRDQDMNKRHYVVPERSGDISFQAGFLAQIDNPVGNKNSSSGNYSDQYRSLVVTRLQHYYTVRGTKNDTSEFDTPEKYFQLITKLIPDFVIKPKTSSPYYELKRIASEQIVASVSVLSSGESQLLTIGLDVFMTMGLWKMENKTDCLMFIDEPDAHIHPDLQIRFASFIYECHLMFPFVQFVIGTHAMSLLSALSMVFKDSGSVSYMTGSSQEIKFECPDRVQSEIHAILGGHVLLSYLFSHPIILVEGDDDYQVWTHIVRGRKSGLCVLSCNGHEIFKYQESLEKTLSAISEKQNVAGYLVLDGDKGKLGTDSKSIKIARLNCRECENMYLTDELILEMGHSSWELACKKIITEASQHGKKYEILMGISGMDRRNDDFKGIMLALSEILDPKRLPWTVRLGKYLGRVPPSGMLKDYLGGIADIVI